MGDDGPGGEDSRAYYTSALHPKHSQPMARRRHSGSVNGSSSSGSRLSSRHGRSRTDSNGVRSKDGYHDPLTPAQNGFSGSAGVTRPYLTSTVNNFGGDFSRDEGTDSGNVTPKEEESVVVVHQITPTDSLAGVSLKYGISLADLRRANHLWVNDPIHLRKELYIPVDKSLRARELIQDIQYNPAPLIDLSTSSSSQTSDTTADNDGLPASLNTPVSTGVDLQRVPTSRLSFFPPPSTSGKMPSISSMQPPLPSTDFKFFSSNSRHSTSSPLVSLLTALPIPASTRDDLLARLSFDSNSSSVSDRSRPSLEGHLEGHELDIISNRNESSYDRIGGSTPSRACTPKARYHEPPALTTRTRKPSPRNTRPHRLSSTPPTSYIPQIPDRTTIRTVQMEPSPVMQLPTLHSRKPRSRAPYGTSNGVANAANNVFELQGSTPQR